MKPDEELLARIKQYFQDSSDVNSDQLQDMQDDIRFVRQGGEAQWPDAAIQARQQVGSERPLLTVNRLLSYNNNIINEIRMNCPGIKVRPCDDEADIETAEILQGIIRNIESQSKAPIAYERAAQNMVDAGIGFFRIVSQYVSDDAWSQEIVIKSIPDIMTVRTGPYQEPDGSDLRWAMIIEEVDKKTFEKQYPDEVEGWQLIATGQLNDGWVGKETVLVAEYFEIKETPAILVQTTDGRSLYKDELKEGDSIINSRKTTRKSVIWAKVGGNSLLEQTELPIKYIPIIPCIGNEYYVDGKKKLYGLTRHGRSPQQLYNYAISSEAELLALSPLAPFMADVESIMGYENLYAVANKKPVSVLPYNSISSTTGQPLPRPERQQLVSQPTGWIAAKQAAVGDIQASLGIYEASQGNNPNDQSGKAIQSLQRQASQGTFHYSSNLARSVAQCGRILVDWIPKVYDTPQIMRILGDDDSIDHVQIDPNQPQSKTEATNEQGEIKAIYNLSVGRYDVACDVGPSYATKRQESAESMIELVRSYPALMQTVGDLLIKNLDWPGADKISERLKKMLPPQLQEQPEGQDPQMQQAQQQMEQMSKQMEEMGQHIQELSDSKDIDQAKIEIEWFKAETSRMEALAKMESGTQPGIEPTTIELEQHASKMANEEHQRELNILKMLNDMKVQEPQEPQAQEQAEPKQEPSAQEQAEPQGNMGQP
jgi:hypothetical protein